MRPLVGRYQQLELKYLPAYMAETAWRSESRQNPDAFRRLGAQFEGQRVTGVGFDRAHRTMTFGRSKPSASASA